MNEKHVKLSFLFLTLIFLMFAITTVGAAEINDTGDSGIVSYDSQNPPVDVSEKTSDNNIRNNEDNNHLSDSSKSNNSNSTVTKSLQKVRQASLKRTDSELKESYFELESDIDYIDFAYQKNVQIRYSLRGQDTEAIPGSTVKVALNNNQTYKYKTDSNGNFIVDFKATAAGWNSLKLAYAGNNEYLPATEKNTFYVKKESLIKCNKISNVVDGSSALISGKLLSDNKGLKRESITVIVNYFDEFTVQTGDDGSFSLNYIAPGTGSIFVEYIYEGSAYNLPSSNSSTYIVTCPVKILLNSSTSVTIGNNITIRGTLSSKDNLFAYEQVTITVAGSSHTVLTDMDGAFELKVAPSKIGKYTIVASFKGDNYYNSAKATTVSNVLLYKTVLTVGSTKNIYVGDNISIYGKITGDANDIPYAKLVINVYGKNYDVTTTRYGNYNLKVKASSAGNKTVTVTYKGTDSYSEATAKTTFLASLKKSLLTLGSGKSAYVGDSVSVYGKLSSGTIALAYADITVTVGKVTYNVTTSKYGNYNLKVSSQTAGNKTITATYAGTIVYANATNTTTYMSNKKESVLTVGSTKSAYVGDSISVYGKLSVRGIGLAYANVTVTVNGKTYIATTSKYGNYNIKVSSQTSGNKTIKVSYAGTNVYAKSVNTTTFQANKKTSVITVGSTKSVSVGSSVSVYGRLSVRDIGLSYANVTITVGTKKYVVTTNKYGDYSLKFTATSAGNKTITASYGGTNVYSTSKASTTFLAKS